MIYVKMPDGKEMGAIKGTFRMVYIPWELVLKYVINK